VGEVRLKRYTEIVCLCGSTKFKEEWLAEQARLEAAGALVLTVEAFMHADGIALTMDQKAHLDCLHWSKIQWSDRVVVIDPGGYIGSSTKFEIMMARRFGKPITFISTRRDDGRFPIYPVKEDDLDAVEILECDGHDSGERESGRGHGPPSI